MIVIIIVFVIGAGFVLINSGGSESSRPKEENVSEESEVLPEAEIAGKNIRVETNKGTIEFTLYGEDAPIAVSNFITLTNKGFYDCLTFHRREEGFVIQGGDPNGDGTGGPGYEFKDEAVTKDYDKGIVAMANSGPDTNGSQFFIMLEDNPTLPKQYTIFGKVTKGQEVVDKIEIGDEIEKVTVF